MIFISTTFSFLRSWISFTLPHDIVGTLPFASHSFNLHLQLLYSPLCSPHIPLLPLIAPPSTEKKCLRRAQKLAKTPITVSGSCSFLFSGFFYCVVSRDEITGHGFRCQDTPAMTLFSGVFTLTYWLPRYRILFGGNLLLTKCCERRDKLDYPHQLLFSRPCNTHKMK